MGTNEESFASLSLQEIDFLPRSTSKNWAENEMFFLEPWDLYYGKMLPGIVSCTSLSIQEILLDGSQRVT